MKNYDIAIIGYGPVGAVTANLFAQKGFNIVVVEPKKDIWNIPRAVHFDGQTQRIFQSMGFMDEISKIIHPMEGISFLNNKGKSIVNLYLKHDEPINGYDESVFFNQPIFEKFLRSEANKHVNIDLKLGFKLANIEANESINNLSILDTNNNEEENITSKYVLACDGANSFVRKSLNIESFDYKCDQDWVVVDYQVDKEYEINTDRYQICDYKRPTTIVPITGQHVRWEFKVNPHDDLKTLEDERNIRKMMQPHLWRLNPDIPLNSGKLLRSSAYTFHGLLANNFKFNNCYLLGDAAHQMPPFLGQGLCQGIKDSYNLCWKLTGVINKSFNKKILNSYSLERKGVVDFVIRGAIKQGDIIGSQDWLTATLRDLYLNIASFIPRLLKPLKFQNSWRIKNGIIDKELFPNNANGVIIPHPALNIKVDNKLFDEYLGNNFGLLVFDNDINVFNDIKKLNSINLFKENIYHINEDNEFNRDTKILRWSKENNISAAIIRPDQHIYGSVGNENIINDIDKLVKKLKSEIL
tara:strand:+ start:1915 stop:3489 length:1575 start_codon:yes stop_codon:yes gene_type:complete